jgi:amino acid transporter
MPYYQLPLFQFFIATYFIFSIISIILNYRIAKKTGKSKLVCCVLGYLFPIVSTILLSTSKKESF